MDTDYLTKEAHSVIDRAGHCPGGLQATLGVLCTNCCCEAMFLEEADQLLSAFQRNPEDGFEEALCDPSETTLELFKRTVQDLRQRISAVRAISSKKRKGGPFGRSPACPSHGA